MKRRNVLIDKKYSCTDVILTEGEETRLEEILWFTDNLEMVMYGDRLDALQKRAEELT